VLGAGFILIAGWRPVGIVLWFIGIALWVVLFYTVMASLTLREPKPDLAAGLNGGWLLLVVGTESVGVLGALLASGASRPDILLFVAFVACMVGLLLTWSSSAWCATAGGSSPWPPTRPPRPTGSTWARWPSARSPGSSCSAWP
jgi:tellurite resistance protein TehA-like permease